MPITVIVGAGPIGLYLALRLKEAGVHHLLVIDPRAGIYTRPGHIKRSLYDDILDRTGIASSRQTSVHIKEAERYLYGLIIQQQVTVEKKQFLRFGTEASKKGIFVTDANGAESFIECDYCFDCTGSKRAVINQVNQAVTPAPFTLTTVSQNVSIKKHLLAYGTIDAIEFKAIESHLYFLNTGFVKIPFEHYIKCLNEFRRFGWPEFAFPCCYGQDFAKNKGCFYIECPDSLTKEQTDAWIDTVLRAYSLLPTSSFKHLPASKKYPDKPRISLFETNPMALNQSTYQSTNLPTVIALGDSEIETIYYTANGIVDGLDRVDVAISQIKVTDGQLTSFNTTGYSQNVYQRLENHKIAIQFHYDSRQGHFILCLKGARAIYAKATLEATVAAEKAAFEKILKEIDVRLEYYATLDKFNALNAKISQSTLQLAQIDNIRQELLAVSQSLISVFKSLPQNSTLEKPRTKVMLIHHATVWKELGQAYFKAKQFQTALDCFNQALIIYQNTAEERKLEMLSLLGHKTMCYRGLNQLIDAVECAKSGLDLMPANVELVAKRKKLLFNLIKAAYGYLTNLQSADANQGILILQATMQSISSNSELIDQEFRQHTETELAFLIPKQTDDATVTKTNNFNGPI